MKRSELRQIIKEEIKRVLKENMVDIKNKYVIKDEEEDFYFIDKQKALDYLSQFNSEEVDAEQFVYDDEGWGEFEQYLENVEQMTNEELENSMRQEMSFYYFSNPNSI